MIMNGTESTPPLNGQIVIPGGVLYPVNYSRALGDKMRGMGRGASCRGRSSAVRSAEYGKPQFLFFRWRRGKGLSGLLVCAFAYCSLGAVGFSAVGALCVSYTQSVHLCE